jgi:hypothetical protein
MFNDIAVVFSKITQGLTLRTLETLLKVNESQRMRALSLLGVIIGVIFLYDYMFVAAPGDELVVGGDELVVGGDEFTGADEFTGVDDLPMTGESIMDPLSSFLGGIEDIVGDLLGQNVKANKKAARKVSRAAGKTVRAAKKSHVLVKLFWAVLKGYAIYLMIVGLALPAPTTSLFDTAYVPGSYSSGGYKPYYSAYSESTAPKYPPMRKPMYSPPAPPTSHKSSYTPYVPNTSYSCGYRRP